MFEPDGLNAFSYWSHLFVGSFGLIGALLALSVAKGSCLHKAGGWIFIFGVGVAAVTALHFQFTRFAAPPVLSSFEAVIGVSTGLLALRRLTPTVRRAELALAAFNLLLLLAFLAVAIPAMQRGVAPPVRVLGTAFIPVVFLLGDVVYLRRRGSGVRLARHLSRMAWTLAIALRAPLFEVRDDFGLPDWTLHLPLLVPPLLLWGFRGKIGRPKTWLMGR
jgi:hypothetical protein